MKPGFGPDHWTLRLFGGPHGAAVPGLPGSFQRAEIRLWRDRSYIDAPPQDWRVLRFFDRAAGQAVPPDPGPYPPAVQPVPIVRYQVMHLPLDRLGEVLAWLVEHGRLAVTGTTPPMQATSGDVAIPQGSIGSTRMS